MSEKYYIPEFEEFHENFECEYSDRDKNLGMWKPIKFSWGIYGDFEDAGNHLDFRVKFLDKQDIEDLGWVCIDKENQFYDYNPNNSPDFCRFALDLNPNNRINIWDNENEVSFAGNIKNKAELKKIMKQLEIL